MVEQDFVNFYAVLESKPDDTVESIEKSFRYLAKQFHPDHTDQADMKRFSLIVEAYETLRDPDARQAYDKEFDLHFKQEEDLMADAQCADQDSADRHRLLSLFYAKRRKDMKTPGIGENTLLDLMKCSSDVLRFHLWYFRQKGYIDREDNGMLAITAEGVDQIEANIQRQAASINRRITMEDDHLEYKH